MNFRLKSFDFWIPGVSVVILSLAITILYSSDPEIGKQQLLNAFLGIVAFIAVSFLDYRILKPFNRPIYIFSLLLLAIVFILGLEVRGSVRWIEFPGFRLQPSEIIKPLLILVLANFLSTNSVASFKNLLISFLIIAVPIAFVFKQPDLGNTLVFLAIWLSMVILSGLKFRYLLFGALGTLLGIPIFWSMLKEYQKQRIVTFLDPFSDPLGSGYNVIQSTIAVGSGEFFGRGLGRGTQSHLQFLPERNTDFIFATLAEELGFFGSSILLLGFAVLIYRCLIAIKSAGDTFGSLIVTGVVGMLVFQLLVNVGMNTGLVPITGITLPLVSYGGSSLLSTMISLGLVESVIRHRKNEEALKIGI